MMVLGLFLLAGCGTAIDETKNDSQSKKQDKPVTIERLQPEIIAENLIVPWSIAKSGSVFYISERGGAIVKIENGKATRQLVRLNKRLAGAQEAGFLGFVLAPDFEQSKKAFAYYTYQDESGQFNRIVELQSGNGEWWETRLLLDKIPSGHFHHGGRLKLGPDGKLYATTGDATQPEIAQDLRSLGGKILRLNLDGSVPEGNPFKNSYVYSYGHRNPQGLAWGLNGTLYESEHGPFAHDDINRILPGKNYGWPVIIGDEKKEGMESPLFHSGNDTWAPSGMAFYKNKLFVATLRGRAVREFDLDRQTTRIAVSGLGRIRDVMIEGDTLYFISNNTDGRGTPAKNDDKLYRLKLAGEM
jgi:glucose/arabinose dehydrogenase